MNQCPYCGLSPLPPGATQCPRCETGLVEEELPGQGIPAGTRLESVEDIRRWVDQEQHGTSSQKPPAAAGRDPAMPFRPTRRPPLALLCVLDDVGDSGEWFRIRAPEVVIGRNDGQIQVPHDNGLSREHFKIYRTPIKGTLGWILKDLESTNGTFVRASAALLRDGLEILVGTRRFRFDGAPPPQALNAKSATLDSARKVTQPWQLLSSGAYNPPALVELTASGEGRRVPLTQDEYWIGSDPAQSALPMTDDPFLSPRHVQFIRDRKGRWQFKDKNSRNGTFVRVQEIRLRATVELQAGEQRFLVKVL